MIDFTKPVKTMKGRKVRVLATDINHPRFPVAAAVTSSYSGIPAEVVYVFTAHGISAANPDLNLVQAPETRIEYGWLDKIGLVTSKASLAALRKERTSETIIRVTYENNVPVRIEVVKDEESE
jgi:hypothetical protein